MACTGVTMKSGLTNASAEEYITKKAIAENANSMILLADHSKFGRISLMTYSSMEKLDAIVTDQPLPEEYRQLLPGARHPCYDDRLNRILALKNGRISPEIQQMHRFLNMLHFIRGFYLKGRSYPICLTVS